MNTPLPPDPARLTLRAQPRRVTRLNRRTLAGLAAIVVVLLGAAVLWAFGAPKKGEASLAERASAEHVPHAEGLSTLPRDYASLPKVPVLGPPLGELGRSTLNAENAAGLAPAPAASNFQPNAEEEARRAEALREQAEANDARKAAVFYQLRQRERLTAQAATAAVDDNAGAASANAPAHERDPNQQDRKAAFLKAKSDASIYAAGSLETPRSPYELLAGTVIPAALWTGINSDLPGEVIATVTENVYDSVTGRFLLIPQGSRLMGEYDSQVAFGQRRVLLVWTRLMMPDGSSVVLDRLPGVDTSGSAGLADGVDWHWGRIFSAAAVSTLIGTSAELAIPQGRAGQGETVIVATRESLQDTVNQVGQELTRRNLDIQPTLTVRPGFPVRAIVNKDVILKPYALGTASAP